jgi:hypothetical protein
MNLCVSKYLLGTNKHLVCDRSSGLFSWSNDVPQKAWFYGNSPRYERSLNDLCLLFNRDPRDKPPEKFVTAYTTVGLPAGLSVPWHLSLPKRIFQKFISDLVEDLWGVLDELNDTIYEEKFLSNRRVLGGLKESHVDLITLKKILASERNPTLISTLKSFSPEKGSTLPAPVYQQGSTGRTIVKRGPKILTLKKEFRSIFKSRYPGGKIIQLDYTSLEPRIMLALAGKDIVDDVYRYVADESGIRLNRGKLKIAVMGALYGISAVKLQSMISRDADASIVLEGIKKIFKINKLSNQLSREYSANSSVSNYYGRPLKFTKCDGHLLVSHYVQSTGVDVCLNGFGKIINEISKKKLKISPIFIIHDALILDVSPEDYDKIPHLSTVGSKIDKFEIDFPISVSNVLE